MPPCRFCRVEIRWCKLVDDGGNIALNVAPAREGTYRVAGADSAMLIPKADRAGLVLYRKHSETCVKADEAAAYYRQLHSRPISAGAVTRTMQSLGGGSPHVWRKPR